jgi:hypothetical protein
LFKNSKRRISLRLRKKNNKNIEKEVKRIINDVFYLNEKTRILFLLINREKRNQRNNKNMFLELKLKTEAF